MLIRLWIDDVIDRSQYLNLVEFYEFHSEGNALAVEEITQLCKDEWVEVLFNFVWITAKGPFTPEQRNEICVEMAKATGWVAEE